MTTPLIHLLLLFASLSHACRQAGHFNICEIPIDVPIPPFELGEQRHGPHVHRVPIPAVAPKQSAANFTPTLIGTYTPSHEKAIQHCMAVAEGFWPGSVTVRVNFSNLDNSFILGSASTSRNWIVNGYLCPVALAEVIVGEDLNRGHSGRAGFDILMTLNSGTNWYLGTDALPRAGQYDLVTVCLHEIFHGLFMSGGNIGISLSESLDYKAIFLRDSTMGRFDSFMANQDGCSIQAYAGNAAFLGQVLTGNNLWFVWEGKRVAKLHAPSPYIDGSSLYHLSEIEYGANQDDLMTPVITSNYAQHQPGGVLMRMLEIVIDVQGKHGADVCDSVNPPERDDTPVEQTPGEGGTKEATGGFNVKLGDTVVSGWVFVGGGVGAVGVLFVVVVVFKCVVRKQTGYKPKRRVADVDVQFGNGNAGGLV